MSSNLPPSQKEDWVLNNVVMPEHTNSWGSAINKLTRAIPLYSSNGNYYKIDSYSNNTIQLSPMSYEDTTNNITPDSYVEGMQVIFKSNFDNTDICSVNINNLGIKQIKLFDGTNVPPFTIKNGYYIELIYDKTQDLFYLKNSTPLDIDKLNVSKMYETGSVSTDYMGYNQLVKLKHSTFDVTKFAVVGSPVISDNGIASGFDNSNYIQATQLKNLVNKSWTIKAKWINQGKTSTTSNVNIVFDMGSYRAWGSISFSITLKQLAFFARTGTKDDKNNEKAWAVKYLSDIPDYINASISFDIKTGTYTAKADWGEGEVLIGTYTPTTENKQLYVINNFPDKYVRIGTGSDNEYNKNATDLKQFSILVDGVEIFCGNETGVDLIKADDYTLIGSPEISDDGIASGFSGSNYLKTNLIALKNNWIIKIKVNFANIADMLSPLFFYSGYNRIILGTDGTITIFASSDNVTAKSLNFSNVVIEVNKNYLLTISFDGVSNYKLIAENLDDKTTAESVKQLASKFPEDPINWFIGGDGERYIQGKIDLNSFKIYTDSDLVYQPCLKIPYIKTKGASKIVDSLYRDRVSDVFEQKGNADYFTLDEENQNFSLPYGEIYGMKADKTEVQDKISELLEKLRPIGQPIIRFDDTIFDDEVRYEGAAVSRTGYANLFSKFGTTYGEGDGSTTFNLPDCRNRTLWGAEDFGYVEAGLPDHTHNVTVNITGSNDDDGDPGNKYLTSPGGNNGRRTLSGTTDAASVANAIYGGSQTVQPPAVKVRVVARYK